MYRIEYGARVVGAPWLDGHLPAPAPLIHRWSHREMNGLGVTICGVRQEDRGNGWALFAPGEAPWHLDYPVCPDCP